MNDLLSVTESLPLVNIESIAGTALVVAPHPDDETLGCGGAIALLSQLNLLVAVSVVSDGTQSHPNSKAYPPPVLKRLRERESLAALAILGVDKDAVTFWGMPDSQVHLNSTPSAIAAVSNYLKNLAPSVIFLPWRYDPHPDHRASWQLFMTASDRLINPPRIIEYPIWDWDTQQRGIIRGVKAWRLDISDVLELKQSAIEKYRSQISDLIDDDPAGFRLIPEMLQNFIQPWEIYLELHE